MILVREAGGLVEAIEPGKPVVESPQIVAANDLIFETFAKTLRKA